MSLAINTISIPTTSTSAVNKRFEELFLDKVKALKTRQRKKRTTNISRPQVMNLDNCGRDNYQYYSKNKQNFSKFILSYRPKTCSLS